MDSQSVRELGLMGRVPNSNWVPATLVSSFHTYSSAARERVSSQWASFGKRFLSLLSRARLPRAHTSCQCLKPPTPSSSWPLSHTTPVGSDGSKEFSGIVPIQKMPCGYLLLPPPGSSPVPELVVGKSWDEGSDIEEVGTIPFNFKSKESTPFSYKENVAPLVTHT